MSLQEFLKLRTHMGFIQICQTNGLFLEYIHQDKDSIPKGWSEEVYLKACEAAIKQNASSFQFVMGKYRDRMRPLVKEQFSDD